MSVGTLSPNQYWRGRRHWKAVAHVYEFEYGCVHMYMQK